MSFAAANAGSAPNVTQTHVTHNPRRAFFSIGPLDSRLRLKRGSSRGELARGGATEVPDEERAIGATRSRRFLREMACRDLAHRYGSALRTATRLTVLVCEKQNCVQRLWWDSQQSARVDAFVRCWTVSEHAGSVREHNSGVCGCSQHRACFREENPMTRFVSV